VVPPSEKNFTQEGGRMSPDHFKKRAQLITASTCVIGYLILAVLAAAPAVLIGGRGAWIPISLSVGSLLLAVGFGRRAARLTRELEAENLDEINKPRGWDQVKADLAHLHNLHGKN